MTRGGAPVLMAWGTALLLVAALGVGVFGLGALPAGLLGGAGALSVALGVALGVSSGASRGHAEPRLLAQGVREPESLGGLALAFGATLALAGFAAMGSAIGMTGAAVAAVGVGLLVRERRLERDR